MTQTDSPNIPISSKHGILSISIKELSVLYSAYMPFVENGGLFIPTRKQYEMGDEVFILLGLMDEPERLPISGRVVWLTPSAAQGNRAQGIGVQFTEKDNPARARIEKYLTGMLGGDRLTHTL
jgi:type IV pilus assembly protein PilZ